MNVDPTTRTVRTTDGLQLVYDEAGTGPAVVFVHGLGLSRLRWRRPYGGAARAGHRAVRFDLRGFGDSDPPASPYGMDRLVADLAEVVDEVSAQPVHLVGHSLGGMIVLGFAVAHPHRVRSLTLASTTARTGRRTGALAEALATVAEHGFATALADPEIRALAESALEAGFPEGARPPLEALGGWLEGLRASETWAWQATVGFDVTEAIGTVTAPALVLHGTADLLVPVRAGERLAQALPRATFVPLPGAGHSIQVERGAEFARALLDHLARA